MKNEVGKFYYEDAGRREFYYLTTGLTCEEIGRNFYLYHVNKFLYTVRKLRKELMIRTKDKLVTFAIYNGLIKPERIKEYL